MATVYLARARGVGGFEREVALKLAHAQMAAEPDFAANLLAEAKVAARIRHPNVVPVLDVGEDAQGVFLVLEYIEGDALNALVKRAKSSGEAMPLSIALRILVDALGGLAAAHELRDEDGAPLDLVHRDFSPHNLLVGVDGITRLTDFGIAKAANQVAYTRSGLIKGKIGYVSPEQARSRGVDRRSDVWAAGVVAWELVAGRRLFPPGDDIGTLLRIVSERPPRVRTIRPDAPAALDDAIAEALEPNLANRAPTARAFQERLVAASASVGGLADVADVARFVEGCTRSMLDARRVQIAEVLRLRKEMATLVRAPVDAMPSTGDLPAASQPSISSEAPTRVTPGPEVERVRRSRPLAPWMALVGATVVAGALVARSQSTTSPVRTPPELPPELAKALPDSPPTPSTAVEDTVIAPAPTMTTAAPSGLAGRRSIPTHRRPSPRASPSASHPASSAAATGARPPPLKNPFEDGQP